MNWWNTTPGAASLPASPAPLSRYSPDLYSRIAVLLFYFAASRKLYLPAALWRANHLCRYFGADHPFPNFGLVE